ncbi:hypothetical protein F1559_005188 [Cyanidiococcus yangmingshanensis]|uniref:Calcineurin-like phosphoesterase domain-containing protein n=1 Tax=Cyanidiococcus yangmingshanensis TaxID=2690220 RepID=A0A7J7IMJ8_9RHOD|nr:hypothetical protein F1559_005188 [Cyanidiococcus yangmingshanensis]
MLSRRLQTILITLSFFCLWKYAEVPRNFFGRSLCNAREAPGLTSNHYGKSAGSNETRSVDVEAESALFALLQISDLHLDYRQSFALQNLRAILYDVIPIVAPKAVIVTGDITNAKRRRGLGHVSQQFAEEWSQYAEAVRQARVEGAVPSDTIWIDLPGNHDMFGVLKRPEPEKNFYLQHCQLHHPNTNGTCLQPRARLFPFHDGHIAILRLDAVPEPSLHRPLNFFGDLPLNQEQARPPASLDERPEDSSPAVIFVAAHYPSSFIHFGSNPKSWLVSKMRHSRVVYLSGHLHTLMGFCPRLYFSKPGRFLDLELADLRFSRRFRIIVMNHALNEFGFRDFSLNPDSGGSGGKVPDWMLVWLRIPTADSESETLNRHGVPNTHWLKFVVWFTQRNCLFPDFEVTLNGVQCGAGVTSMRPIRTAMPLCPESRQCFPCPWGPPPGKSSESSSIIRRGCVWPRVCFRNPTYIGLVTKRADRGDGTTLNVMSVRVNDQHAQFFPGFNCYDWHHYDSISYGRFRACLEDKTESRAHILPYRASWTSSSFYGEDARSPSVWDPIMLVLGSGHCVVISWALDSDESDHR